MDIKEIKREEVDEIYHFLSHLEDYGHIYNYSPEKLDNPFKKMMEAIEEVKQLMEDSYDM